MKTSIQSIVLELLTSAIRRKKQIEGVRIRKKEREKLLFRDDKIVYIRALKEVQTTISISNQFYFCIQIKSIQK